MKGSVIISSSSGRRQTSPTSPNAMRGHRAKVTAAERAQICPEKPRSPERPTLCTSQDAVEGAHPVPLGTPEAAKREAGCTGRRLAHAPGRQLKGSRMESTHSSGGSQHGQCPPPAPPASEESPVGRHLNRSGCSNVNTSSVSHMQSWPLGTQP